MFVFVEGEIVVFVNGVDGRFVFGGVRKGVVFGEFGVIMGWLCLVLIEVVSVEVIVIFIFCDVIDDLL